MPSRREKSARKQRPGWSGDALVTALIVVLVMALNLTTDLFGGLERKYYDFASSANDRAPSDRIAIIAIDDQSIANIGRWPWPREVHARLIDALAGAGAKTIAYTAFFFEPQNDRGLESLRELRRRLGSGSSGTDEWADLGGAARQQLLDYINTAEKELDSDGRLVASIASAGNVVVPSLYTLGEPVGPPEHPLPSYARRSAISDASGYGMVANDARQPLEAVGSVASGVAHLNQLVDRDGVVRAEPLWIQFDGHAVPSMALMVAAKSLNLGIQDIRLLPGEAVMLGRSRIETDPSGVVMPQFYATRGGREAFPVDSFYDVISGRIPASKYAGKIVIVGATAAGVGSFYSTPVSPAQAPATILAHITSSLLDGHFIVQPAWAPWFVVGILMLVVAYLVAVLPRLSATAGAGVTLGAFALFLGLEYGLLASKGTWLRLVFPASLLVMGHLALVTRRFGVTEARKLKSDAESAETNRMMGLALQGQGQLDMAFDRLRRVPYSETLMDNLRQLAQDFERKRQFNKAEAVYEHMANLDQSDHDTHQRLGRARDLARTVVLGGPNAHPGGTLLLSDMGVEKPMLGRYLIERELGKGAMGTVYLGRDPKIGRVVAIKTLALVEAFDGEALPEARTRFFREAETAGRLQHPNIVTIFDAGEDHDLAYIAMEFLQGRDLSEHARPDHLLPMHKVLDIVARVAGALDYAHRQNVVHRDIKPGNVMYDSSTDTLKVTDFGIARITDASRTRTGMVLGTPSFMSPEQLAGKHVDGRSDLYSLGVMLFQLLTGMLPFRGDSLAALMYQIANQDAPDLRVVRPDAPDLLADILIRCLAKAADQRYASGSDLAEDLRRAQSVVLSVDGVSRRVGGDSTGNAPEFEKTQISPPKQQDTRSDTLVVTASVTNVADQNDDGFHIQL